MPPTPPARPWPARVPTVLWAPLTAAGLVIEVGVLGIIANQPWLYPSLGPSALVQAEFPNQQAARFRDVFLGHMIGLGAGLLAVWLVGADAATALPASGQLSADRVWAAAIAIAGTIVGLIVLRVSQPPAASTTLVVALGGLQPTFRDVAAVVVGALILGGSGEVIRRVRLRGAR